MSREEKKNRGKFVVTNVTSFDDLASKRVTEVCESDLCFQSEQSIIQLKYVKPEEEKLFDIEPGTYLLTETSIGLRPTKMELRKRSLLETIDNTKQIINEAEVFFNKLHVYEELGRPKKRAVLLYSKPGLGKTSSITKVCDKLIAQDPGTVVFNWPTSAVEADSVNRFLEVASSYDKTCTRLVLIIEDIGGGERDGEGGKSGVPSGLLDLLDGVGNTFKIPTFILATTNYPENLLENLADRPGRFDFMLELLPPTKDEKAELLKFIAKREVTKEEIEAICQKGTEGFSIAHIEELVVRHRLHDKTIPQVVKELLEHSKKFKAGFENRRSVGMGGTSRYND